MSAQRFGHYRLEGKIGAGGMGVVYLAHDESLDRNVAIKVLPSESLGDATARARLLREARVVAALNHPHICTIHEVGEAAGQAYIAMEFVEGQPLSERLAAGPLPLEQVLRYAGQIADALAHAHDHRIVHRDLKSANVLITPAGRAKVLDFGLARCVSGGEPDETTRAEASLTAPGVVAGTLPYMAPEQLQGQPADARSDVWALGVVLYEMAAGARPFQGQTAFQLSSAILKEAPASLPPDVPVELRVVIGRCLEKEPGRRYQRAGEVHAVLDAIQGGTASTWRTPDHPPNRARRLRLALAAGVVALFAVWVATSIGELRERFFGASGPGIQSIAVLPLENLSGDPEEEYFVDGMTEEVIAKLAQISAVKVISRTSVMQYKKARKSVPEIARELAIDAVVEGSVRRVGSRVRITANLVHASSDRHLWGHTYERDVIDILSLQSEVAAAIAGQVDVAVRREETGRRADAERVDPEAYDLYSKGRYLWATRAGDNVDRSVGYFEKAIEKAPTFALAYAALANSYVSSTNFGSLPGREAFPKAREAAAQALRLDSALAEAHGALGMVRWRLDWDWAEAEREFRHALELNPNYETGHQWYGLLLTTLGRMDEGLKEIRLARELDPLSPVINANVCWVHYHRREYDAAVEECRRTLEFHGDFPTAHDYLGAAYTQMGLHDQAIAAHQRASALRSLQKANEMRTGPPRLAYAHARAGNRAQAETLLNELLAQREARSYQIAQVYAGLGRNQEALVWLEKALADRETVLYIKVDPAFDPLDGDPRFQALLRRMNFPQ